MRPSGRFRQCSSFLCRGTNFIIMAHPQRACLRQAVQRSPHRLSSSGHLIYPVLSAGFSCLFHLLDCITGSLLPFCILNRHSNITNLFLNRCRLTFYRKRNTFKLAVPDDNGIIIPGSNPGTEFLSVGRFKILLCGNKDVCPG